MDSVQKHPDRQKTGRSYESPFLKGPAAILNTWATESIEATGTLARGIPSSEGCANEEAMRRCYLGFTIL